MLVPFPYLRDGVDVYLKGEKEIHFLFLATRKRLVVRAKPHLQECLAWLDGNQTRQALEQRMAIQHGAKAEIEFSAFLEYLETEGIVIDRSWINHVRLGATYTENQERQLTFLLDMVGSPARAIEVQTQIADANIICFGVGAVGSWLVRILIGLGFRRFNFVDHDVINRSDVSRHAFFDVTGEHLGENKARVLAETLHSMFPWVEARASAYPLSTDTDLAQLIGKEINLVVNTADQPYIGYTAILLSRFCARRQLPLLVAGGFDAHLASIGELIIPGVTPCADCYAEYFQNVLAEWIPVKHPVSQRRDSGGGLCTQSVFAAAAAAMEVMRLFAGTGDPASGRGELLFEDYRLDAFTVGRWKDCPTCSQL